MAYAHVQSTTSVADNAVATSSVSFGSTPTVGNLVIVGISSYRSATERTIVRVTDNQTGGNFYQEDIEDVYGTATSVTAVYSCKVGVASGTFTLTVVPTRHATADHYIGWGAAEFSGTGGANMPTFRGEIPGAVQSYAAAASGTISRTTSAGSIWVICLSQSSSGSRSYTISDTGGLTWSDVVDGTTMLAEGATNFAESHIWWAYDSAGGSRTATVSLVSSTSTFVLTDLEFGGLNTSTPGDVVDIEVEGATSTAHSHTAKNTSANGGIGLVWATSESGNVDYTTPTENGKWSKMLGGTNANRYLMLLRRTNGALTSETGSHDGGTARQMNSIMVFFKAASAVTPWADKNGTNESATGDANVTASAANTNANALVVGVATVLNVDTDINISDTPPTGTTQITFVENASATIGHSFVFKIVSSAETSALQWTHDNTSQSGWNAVIQTYRDDAGSGTSITPGQGNLALSATAPTALQSHLAAPARGDLALSATAPTVSQSQAGIAITIANADLRLTAESPALATTIVSFGWTYAPITTNATSFATASATPTNGRLYILGVMSSHASAPTTPTVTGGGMTWVQIATQTISTTHRVTLFRAMVSSGATTGALTIDFAGVTQTGGGAWCYEIEHAENSGSNGENAILQIAQGSTAAAAAFDASFTLAWRTNSVGAATIARNANTAMTPRSGWTGTQGAGYASPSSRMVQHQRVTADTAIGVTDTTDTRGGVGVEIQNKANGGSKSLAPIAAMLALSTFGSSLGLGINPAQSNLALSSAAPTVQVSEGISVQPGQANLALSSSAPSVYQEHLRYPVQGNLVLSAVAPDRVEGKIRETLQGNLALSTVAPAALQEHLSYPAQGNLALSASAPTALLAHLANPSQGNLILSAVAPTALQSHLANPTLGNLALSTVAPTVLQSHFANPALGNLVLSATAPTVSVDGTGTNISPAQGNLALSTAAPTALQSHLAYPSQGNLVLSATAPSLGGAISVNPDAGTLTLSVVAPTVTQAHLRLPAHGNLTFSSTAPTVSVNLQRDTLQGNLALSTTAPTALHTHFAYPGQGALTLTTEAPNLGGGTFIAPTTGNLVLSSVKPAIDAGIAPTLGNLTLTTSSPAVVVPVSMTVTAGNLALSSEAPTRVVASGSHVIAVGRVRLKARVFSTDVPALIAATLTPRVTVTDVL